MCRCADAGRTIPSFLCEVWDVWGLHGGIALSYLIFKNSPCSQNKIQIQDCGLRGTHWAGYHSPSTPPSVMCLVTLRSFPFQALCRRRLPAVFALCLACFPLCSSSGISFSPCRSQIKHSPVTLPGNPVWFPCWT